MNWKKPIYLGAMFCGAMFYVLGSQCSYGYVADIPINRANLKTYCPFLKVDALRVNETNNEYVLFTVSLIPTKTQESEHFTADLHIGVTNDFIVYTSVQAQRITDGPLLKDLPERLKARCVKFQFCVGVKYLAKAQFSIVENYGEPYASASAYEIDLEDFANQK
jgi:hypothetical protein